MRRHGPVLIGDVSVWTEAAPYVAGRRAGIVTSTRLQGLSGRVAERLGDHGVMLAGEAVVPDGEEAKSALHLDKLWEQFGDWGLNRDDLLISVGGGAVTDLAGFAAATWMRGIDVLHVPTTVLAMADAAIGGKTGIDTRWGKNLVGAFHPPLAVVCDLSVLDTLPERELRSGLAEILKAGFLGVPGILEHAEVYAGAPEPDWWAPGGALRGALEAAVAFKQRVTSDDLLEAGRREHLNYGHTLGHALETWSAAAEHDPLRHGEAVAIGMVAAAELSALLGLSGPDLAAAHRRVLATAGLPVTHGCGEPEVLLGIVAQDKKSRGGQPRFVLLDGSGAISVRPVERSAIEEAIRRTHATAR